MTSKFRSSSDALNEKFGSSRSVSNRNSPTSGQENSVTINKNLAECCYSISNLALIIACIIALAVLIKFIQDDPLYDYGEHLLSLHFYRELIYIIVVIPLVLLIPILNAASACFITSDHKHELTKSILNVRLFYQLLMLILVFIGLIFIAPNIRASSLSKQIELELRKHMKFRYENSFSYEFLDRLQEQYECCDEPWYRANMHDNLPTSCFVPDGTYSLIYDETCADSIGSLVSTRCCFLASALVVIIIALVSLISVDIRELLLPSKSRQYEVNSRGNDDANLLDSNHQKQQQRQPSPLQSSGNYSPTNNNNSISKNTANWSQRTASISGGRQEDDFEEPTDVYLITDTANDRDYDSDDSYLGNQTQSRRANMPARAFRGKTNRLDPEERSRECPLIRQQKQQQQQQQEPAKQSENSTDFRGQDLSDEQRPKSPTILTRASYNLVARDRSQSPVFLATTEPDRRRSPLEQQSHVNPLAGSSSSRLTGAPAQPIIKSALKKTLSQQRVASGSSQQEELYHESQQQRASRGSETVSMSASLEDAESLDDYVARLRSNSLIRQQREQQSKRSLLSVRFAD